MHICIDRGSNPTVCTMQELSYWAGQLWPIVDKKKKNKPKIHDSLSKYHPGHHVALLLSSTVPHGGSLRVTRIKLLRPSDYLLLGHVYRLISSQEVMRGLRAKKSEKMKKIYGEYSVAEEDEINPLTLRSESASNKETQRKIHEKQRGMMNNNKVRVWQPSLQSISESTR